MKKFILILVLFFAGTASAKTTALSQQKIDYLQEIKTLSVEYEVDPFEMAAIAWVESRLSPHVVNRSKDAGMFQVNCIIYNKKYRDQFAWMYDEYKGKYTKTKIRKLIRKESIKACIEANTVSIEENFLNAAKILNVFRTKYWRYCRGSYAYACYAGGQGWRVVHPRRGRIYMLRISRAKKFFKKHYYNYLI